jgi:hypothetical protein
LHRKQEKLVKRNRFAEIPDTNLLGFGLIAEARNVP